MNYQPTLQAASSTKSECLVSGVLQRQCGCGKRRHGGGTCSACQRKRTGLLQRAAVHSRAGVAVPPLVHEVLRTPGQPLDAGTRAFMEPRFGKDFSRVRVHTDSRAAESANAVGAAAYTVGRHIVFAAGQYAPSSPEGRRLLAHELAHVVQQEHATGTLRRISHPTESSERVAETTAEAIVRSRAVAPLDSTRRAPILSRLILRSTTRCPADTNGAPADPLTDIADRDDRAREFTASVRGDLHREAGRVRAGLGFSDIVLEATYETRFGTPNPVGTGFMNRLTGQVRPTLEQAESEELEILSRRFGLMNRLFSQFISYRCIGGAANFAGCAPPHCNSVFAWSCAGTGAIFLCPDFWDTTGLDPVQFADQQAGILIHESAHIIIADIGDATLRGPGRNYRTAECYASFIADVFGFPSPVAPCPAPPPNP